MNVLKLPARDWRDHLQISTSGYKANLHNAALALRMAPCFAGALRFDLFQLRTVVAAPLPWSEETEREWTNIDDLRFVDWLQQHDLGIGLQIAQQAVELAAHDTEVHPLREWLSHLEWDGEARLDRWLTYYIGAEHTPLTRAVGARWCISAVARVMEPGCKADHVLVIEGRQGVGKSTALRTLVGEDWFTDELSDLGSKDAAMQMRGVWVIELAELDHLSRTDAGRIKAVISRRSDRFRPPYGERLITAPRECVFAGTVNDSQYLKDDTGNRRFWPVLAGPSVDLGALAQDREQLWAEAVARYRKREPWHLHEHDLIASAEEQQERRTSLDPWLDKIDAYVTGRAAVTTTEILGDCLSKKSGDWTRADEMRAAKCLTGLGFERKRAPDGGRRWRYERAVSQP